MIVRERRQWCQRSARVSDGFTISQEAKEATDLCPDRLRDHVSSRHAIAYYTRDKTRSNKLSMEIAARQYQDKVQNVCAQKAPGNDRIGCSKPERPLSCISAGALCLFGLGW
jgi:hypothetical protein